MPTRGKARAAILVELSFDAVLLVLFIAQAFLFGCLLLFGHIPLPSDWVNGEIARQLPDGLSLRAENYSLTLDGRIELDEIELYTEGIGPPIFRADGAVIELHRESWFSLRADVAAVVLSNGELTLPAVYSPTGKNSSILRRIALRMLPKNGELCIDSFAALHDDIRLRGSLHVPISREEQKSVDANAMVDRFFKRVAVAIREKSRIEGLEQPTLFFKIECADKQSFNIHTRVSSRQLQLPQFSAGNISLHAMLALQSDTLISKSPLLLRADHIELAEYQTKADSFKAWIDGDDWKALLQGEWPEMEIAAHSLHLESVELDSPRIKVNPQAFPEIHFAGTTSGLDGAVEFTGQLNARTRTAHVQAAGSVDILSAAPSNLTNTLPPVDIEASPYYNLSLEFEEGFALESAKLRARIDKLSVKGIHFDHIRAEGSYRNGIYSIDHLYLRRDWQWLDLGLHLNSATNDYGLSLVGFAKPYEYNDILPRWWGAIFRDFDFEQVEDGLADFIIYGNTKRRAADLFFGHAKARKVAYKGVMVDEGELIVRGRGPYAEVHRLDAISGDGYARGKIGFASRLDQVRAPMCVRLDLDTKLKLSDAENLFDEDVAAIIADFETEALPRTRLVGAIFNSAYPEFAGKSYLDLTVRCPSPITYKGMPLDYIGFDLYGRSEITYLRDIHLGYAGGKGFAQADVLTPNDGIAEARFTFQLEGADQDQAIRKLNALNAAEAIEAHDDLPTTSHSKGWVNLQLDARGPANDPNMFVGYGHFDIRNESLSSIELFGPLSRLLKDTRLGFTSFALTEMDGAFALDHNTVKFSELSINGPRTRIEAPGTLRLDNLSLAMRVSVYLFGNAGNPESGLRKLGELITKPIPNLLEFELTGTPDKQKWRSLYDPRKLIPQF